MPPSLKGITALAAAVLSLLTAPALSQTQSHVPAPEDVLGYRLGDRYTSHAGIENYLQAVAGAAPERIRLGTYGSTYEGRPLHLVIVSSPENLSRLEEIRSSNIRLADPRTIGEDEAERLSRTMPAIVWLSYGVHGNEASSPESALDVIHHLASGTDSGTADLLKNLVVIIDPLLNPDGHERYVNFEITHAGHSPNEDPAAVEHHEGWPSGRSNHYYFDLNRDWVWLTQEESRARIKAYRQWMPHVHVDFHEMGYNSSYFFFPAIKPVNKNLPASTIEWGEIYGKGNAGAFDTEGWKYYSGESFDLFYPGYGDSWPSLHGAIGMTYEQGGQVGIRVKREDKEILTLRERILHHSTTSMATLRTTAANREKRLRDFHAFFREAIDEGKHGPVRTYIVPPGKDPGQSAKMINLLIAQGVEVRRATEDFTVAGTMTYIPEDRRKDRFPAGTYLIGLDQPAKRFIVALMEREPAITDTSFYDISAWCLPIAFGVKTYWSSSDVSVPSVPLGEAVPPAGSVLGGAARYAYIIPWTSNDAIRALVRLQQEDFKVHVALREFTYEGQRFARGSIIIPVHGNSAKLDERLRQLSGEYHITITAANTGFTESGMNLGSDRAILLKTPRIAVVTDRPVSSTAFGSIWSMFDNDYGLRFVPVRLSTLRWADLREYTAIVFPDDGRNGYGYAGELDSTFAQRLKTWIGAGGTFVGLEGGAVYASRDRSGIASVKLKSREKKDEDEKKKEKARKDGEPDEKELEKMMTVEERMKKRRRDDIPGTIVSVRLDNTHPLGYGYDTTIAVFRTTGTAFELAESGYNVGIYTDSPRVSGHMTPPNEEFLARTPFLVHQKSGSGNVILFADDPNFRLFWDSLNRVFLNSVLLMPSIRYVEMSATDERGTDDRKERREK